MFALTDVCYCGGFLLRWRAAAPVTVPPAAACRTEHAAGMYYTLFRPFNKYFLYSIVHFKLIDYIILGFTPINITRESLSHCFQQIPNIWQMSVILGPMYYS